MRSVYQTLTLLPMNIALEGASSSHECSKNPMLIHDVDSAIINVVEPELKSCPSFDGSKVTLELRVKHDAL